MDSSNDNAMFSLPPTEPLDTSMEPTPKKKKGNEFQSDILKDTSDAIRSVTSSLQSASKTKYDDEVEAFGEFVKAELQSIKNSYDRDDIKHKIHNIIYEAKLALRNK